MWPILIAVCILSFCHGLVGIFSVCIGVAASVNAEVWLAHSVAPIWSGAFLLVAGYLSFPNLESWWLKSTLRSFNNKFFVTAVIGFLCAKKRTTYLIMCFAAFSLVSMVTAVVSIQLLKNGLVNHTSDGETFRKDEKDMLVIIAIATAGSEILLCIISTLISCKVAQRAKIELHKKNEGTFSVEILAGDKDIIVHTTKPGSYDKLSEQPTESSNSIEENQIEQCDAENEFIDDRQALAK